MTSCFNSKMSQMLLVAKLVFVDLKFTQGIKGLTVSIDTLHYISPFMKLYRTIMFGTQNLQLAFRPNFKQRVFRNSDPWYDESAEFSYQILLNPGVRNSDPYFAESAKHICFKRGGHFCIQALHKFPCS